LTPCGSQSPPAKLNPYQRTIERRRNNLFSTAKLSTPKPGLHRQFNKDYRPLENYKNAQNECKNFTGGLFPIESNEYEINGQVNHTKFLENMNMFAQQINQTDSLADIPENYHKRQLSFSKTQTEKRKITIGKILSSRENIKNQINNTARGLRDDPGFIRDNHKRNLSDEKIASKMVNPLRMKTSEPAHLVF
jgi:hypothetical protein